jgi:hypothetical protein
MNRDCGVETCPVVDLPADLASSLHTHEEEHQDPVPAESSESYLSYFRYTYIVGQGEVVVAKIFLSQMVL